MDVLYKLRCDVVHEGRYYDFNMRRTRHPMRTHRPWPVNLCTELSVGELREIVLRGVVNATRKLLSTLGPEATL